MLAFFVGRPVVCNRVTGASGRSCVPAPGRAPMGTGGAQAAALLPFSVVGEVSRPLYISKPTLAIDASQHRIGMVLNGCLEF